LTEKIRKHFGPDWYKLSERMTLELKISIEISNERNTDQHLEHSFPAKLAIEEVSRARPYTNNF